MYVAMFPFENILRHGSHIVHDVTMTLCTVTLCYVSHHPHIVHSLAITPDADDVSVERIEQRNVDTGSVT